jgi:hypothetical protein
VADEEVLALLRDSAISFTGTVETLGAATVPDIPVDERTAVVVVDSVLHAPAAFSQLAGQRVTVQLSPDAEVPQPGERLALFANAIAYGDSLAVGEVGRLAPDEVDFQGGGFGVEEPPVSRLSAQLAAEQVKAHADEAAAVVVARVIGLRKVSGPATREHDPDWWLADLEVFHVERGPVQEGPLSVVYANSLDVRWRSSPKPKASQDGLWILHATEGTMRDLGDYYLMDSNDYSPIQGMDEIQGGGE